MKSFKFILIFGLILLSSCSNNLKTISSGKKIDSRLVGVLYGSEKDKQIEGIEKSWEMTRFDNGTFTLDFTFIQDGETEKSNEKGTWWVEDGKFYEHHEVTGFTDVYKYKVLDSEYIKFISENMSLEIATESYEFIDTRKK